MNIDKLKSSWQQQGAPIAENVNLENKMKLIEDKVIQLDKGIKKQNIYAVLTFGLIIISMTLFNYFIYLLDESIWVVIGLGTWIFWISVNLVRLYLVRRTVNIDESQFTIGASLRYKLGKVKKEIYFYQTIVWWILAPLSIGFILILLGTQASLAESFTFIGLYVLGCFWSSVYNKKYIAKKLTPIELALNESLNSLAKKN